MPVSIRCSASSRHSPMFCAIMRLGASERAGSRRLFWQARSPASRSARLQVAAPRQRIRLVPHIRRPTAGSPSAFSPMPTTWPTCSSRPAFVAALASAGRTRNIQRYSALLIILAAAPLHRRRNRAERIARGIRACSAGHRRKHLDCAPPSETCSCQLGFFTGPCMLAAAFAIASTSIGSSRIGQEAMGPVSRAE